MTRRTFVFFGAVLALSFLLLMVVFRSLLVPLKAVVMNVLSIAAAYLALATPQVDTLIARDLAHVGLVAGRPCIGPCCHVLRQREDPATNHRSHHQGDQRAQA